jgi:hypothetical protein
MRRRLHSCQAGVIALIAMVLPLSMHRCLCSPGIFAIIAIFLLPLLQWCSCCLHAGVVALVTMASSPSSMRRHLCRYQDGVVTPHCTGTIANIAWALLPLLHQLCCLYCADLFALTLHEHHHSHCTGVVAPVDLACLRCCTGVIALVTLALLPLVHWHYPPCCAGLFALVVIALCSRFSGVFALVELACTKPQTTW